MPHLMPNILLNEYCRNFSHCIAQIKISVIDRAISLNEHAICSNIKQDKFHVGLQEKNYCLSAPAVKHLDNSLRKTLFQSSLEPR